MIQEKRIDLGKTNQGDFAFTIGDEKIGNGEEYSVAQCVTEEKSPLQGKTIYWLGSSITYGFGSKGESMADFIARKTGSISYKSAISGTTLAEIPYDKEDETNPWKFLGRDENSLAETAEQSYVSRLTDFPEDGKPDAFVIQVSTNDSQFPPQYQGTISAQGENFDIHTTLGAMEYIISYIKKKWNCPIMFYTSPLLDSDNYRAMVEATKKICNKWNVDLLDMNGEEALNRKGKEQFDLYMVDWVHPTRAGYQLWWTPAFEEKLIEIIRNGEE